MSTNPTEKTNEEPKGLSERIVEVSVLIHTICRQQPRSNALSQIQQVLETLYNEGLATGKLEGVKEVKEELDLASKLLEQRMEVLNLIPECPEHGKNCMPHQQEWITKKVEGSDKYWDAISAEAARRDWAGR